MRIKWSTWTNHLCPLDFEQRAAEAQAFGANTSCLQNVTRPSPPGPPHEARAHSPLRPAWSCRESRLVTTQSHEADRRCVSPHHDGTSPGTLLAFHAASACEGDVKANDWRSDARRGGRGRRKRGKPWPPSRHRPNSYRDEQSCTGPANLQGPCTLTQLESPRPAALAHEAM